MLSMFLYPRNKSWFNFVIIQTHSHLIKNAPVFKPTKQELLGIKALPLIFGTISPVPFTFDT